TARRRAQRQSRMAEGHREAAPRVLDGREHGGSLAAEGRRPITRHIAVYPRKLTAANSRLPVRSCMARASSRMACWPFVTEYRLHKNRVLLHGSRQPQASEAG